MINKEVAIGFRTEETIKQALDKMAREERRTLSSLIELILYQYLKNKNLLPADYDENH